MNPTPRLAAAAAVLSLTLAVASCSANDPAQPVAAGAEPNATPSAAFTTQSAITLQDAVLASESIEAFGAQIVLVRGDTRGMATLYSLAQQTPATIALDVEPDEAVEGVSWAVEQDEDADPVAVALVYISTEASGLNATADKIQMRVYNDTGTELSRTELPSHITGTPSEPGDLGGATPSRFFTVVNGTAVFTTELSGGTYAAIGFDVTTAAETWRVTGDVEPRDVGAPLSNGWVALDWGGALTAFDPGTGSVQWRTDQMSSVTAHGAAPFLTGYASPAAWTGPDPVEFIDAATGAVITLPDGFTSYAVDPLTGESTFLWPVSESSPPDKPGILVRSPKSTDVFALDAPNTAAAGVQDVLAMWNGYLWIETGAGNDIVVAATGDRAPGISTGDTVLRVPKHASRSWIITEIDGGTFGDDTLILTRHPGGTTNLDDLNVLAPAPTTR